MFKIFWGGQPTTSMLKTKYVGDKFEANHCFRCYLYNISIVNSFTIFGNNCGQEINEDIGDEDEVDTTVQD